jgi:hypothetical protein
MLYSSLPALDGIRGPARGSGCSDSGWMDFGDWMHGYPDTAAQVGLYLVEVRHPFEAWYPGDDAVDWVAVGFVGEGP